jgi:hypothetical protein
MTAPASAPPRSFRPLLARVAVLALAVAAGLLLQRALARELDAIRVLAETDVLAARAQLAAWLRVGGAALFGLTGSVGVSVLFSSRRAIAEGRFPPTGVWSWGATQVVTGTAARRMGWIGIGLGAALVLCSAVAVALTWTMGAALLACRAV